mgnify:CR=1 FL=1
MSRRTGLLLGITVMLGLLVPWAIADWIPEDGHKMHYPQLPDETGWAVNATQPMILADDWQCSETGWVKDVHFWGAWKNGIEGQVVSFVLSFHEDIPADQSPAGYSMPGATLAEFEVTEFVVTPPIDPPTMEGWYDPMSGEVIPEDHQPYYQYNIFLPESQWFPQEEGTIYWLNISAIVADPAGTQWGWKSTQDHWNDDAVWAEWGDLSWEEMYEPQVVDTLINDFNIAIDPAGMFLGGGGGGAYGQGWYFYPETDWWNIWYFDHPLNYDRYKEVLLDYDIFPIDPSQPSYVEVAVNWSLDSWPDEEEPPLPGNDDHIGRAIVYSGPVEGGHFTFPYEIMEYNPVWVSVDVRGYNFEIPLGLITHICAPRDSVSLDLSFVITGEPEESDTCDYYKSPYPDYTPQGMPDFDMKQLNWIDLNGKWSHDGPAALSDCIWWFDSKFEPFPIDPRPFGSGVVNDGFGLVTAYGNWDDHDTMNVQPLVTDLANNWLNTNPGGIGGTAPWDMQNGLRAYLRSRGLDHKFTDTVVGMPTIDYIRQQVLESQDVILLLGFYEDIGGYAQPIGWHYVTVAGCCTDQPQICISDPYLDVNEGEPPAGSAHGGTIHNDANNISGPHGQIQHDPYTATSMVLPGGINPVEVLNYPTNANLLANFEGMNNVMDWTPWQGGTVYTTIDLAWVICPDTTPEVDSCDYYKAPYEDYSPNGMPDFDQKQDNWSSNPQAPGPPWTHCGPTALANCLWWFDSKFEPNPLDPRPFGAGPLNDGYGLVPSFDPTGLLDDHDTANVMPLIDSLALYCNTNGNLPTFSGTDVNDLFNGVLAWLAKVGLSDKYNVNLYPVEAGGPGFEFLREQILESQDVILLLGFYHQVDADYCERIGGHYVTCAGVCTNPEDSALCISDPYYDMHEGEPPAGSAHGSDLHNDAWYVSGPHGTIHHDKYQVSTLLGCGFTQPPFFSLELPGYPVSLGDAANFYGQNAWGGGGLIPPTPGMPIHTVVEFALIICPEEDTSCCILRGDINHDGTGPDISDLVYLTSYMFAGGPQPPCEEPPGSGYFPECDVNGDGTAPDISDLVYLVTYMFQGGPAPIPCP